MICYICDKDSNNSSFTNILAYNTYSYSFEVNLCEDHNFAHALEYNEKEKCNIPYHIHSYSDNIIIPSEAKMCDIFAVKYAVTTSSIFTCIC